MGFYGGVEVDGAAVARALDDIRAGLERPSVGHPFGSMLGHDRAAILQSLEAVLTLASGDLSTKQALASLTPAFAPAQTAGLARQALADLETGLVRRVEARLGRERCAALTRRIEEPLPDVLAIFRKQLDENAHSDLIAWLLDPRSAPTVAPVVLRSLANHLVPAWVGTEDRGVVVAEWQRRIASALVDGLVGVRREYVFGREWDGSDALDRIDIVVLGPDFTIAIENKVRAGEHDEQTLAYWSWLSRLPAPGCRPWTGRCGCRSTPTVSSRASCSRRTARPPRAGSSCRSARSISSRVCSTRSTTLCPRRNEWSSARI